MTKQAQIPTVRMEFNQWGSKHQTQVEIRAVIKKEEPDDPGWEQTSRGTRETKAIKKESRVSTYTEVLVLSEIEESDEAGRVCHTLKYQPRFIHISNGTDVKAEDVPAPEDPNPNDIVVNKKHICKVCDAEYISLTELELHMEDHEGSVWYCSKIKKDKVCKNKKTEASQKHVCELCGFEYARKQSLKIHMRIHTGESPHQCKICGKSFRRSDWLAGHLTTHRDNSDGSRGGPKPKKNHPCDQCEKRFRKKNDLRYHMRTHTGEKPYQCSICKMTFHYAGVYQRHLNCHSDYRPYECSECGNSFKRSATLDKHKRIHTREKPFSCSCCGKTYRYEYSLAVHRKKRCQARSQ